MATDCSLELKRTMPLHRVVSAAIIDMHEDIGRLQQVASHHAARGLRKLNREVLKMGIQKVTLTVNRNTNTAALPPDFHEEIGVYALVNDIKIPLKVRTDLVDAKGTKDIPCEDKCPRCSQDKAICDELTVTEDVTIVNVNGFNVQQTVVKRLYPDGSYFLETEIPLWDVETDTIVYTTTKQYITAIDLKPCGCPENTEENIEKIKCCNYDVYCSYYAGCDRSCTTSYGGYRIFEETGLIQFDNIGSFTKVYMEFWGFMPKKNGQYQVPEIAFETLVNYTKFKWVENKRNISLRERDWYFERYRMERGNMEKIMGRIDLHQILQAVWLLPKFDVGEEYEYGSCIAAGTTVVAAAPIASACDAPVTITQAPCPPQTRTLTPFQIAVIAGMGAGPVPGTTVYQHSALIEAMNLNFIIVNSNTETILQGAFTFDPVTGIIDRAPNQWVAGDVLIVSFAKMI